ncbi:MAG: S-methyl-5-thioribose-1-phosphate isomerase [Clostridia bacterium]|nr:S-methyl-5-thioribose-1-phosphate isomerase [Clostridia bacterium]
MISKLDNYETVALSGDKSVIEIIDQTLLPRETKAISLETREEIYEAIKKLRVRGAPAIGVCAALGVYVCALHSKAEDIYADVASAAAYIRSSRPTAVNLMWAVDRMMAVAEENKTLTREDFITVLLSEAEKIHAEDIECCRMIGENGLTLLKEGDGILTHCNAGRLATVKYGTATAPMYLGHERGYNFKVYCDETRPLLQGARLTATELKAAGLDVTLLCDNMSGALMRTGRVNAVIVGCDRVAANGDTANKIGTSMVATLAARYGIPFYVAAPTSTIDMSTARGEDINIEEREPTEVTEMWYESPMAPEGIKVFNPAFDVTDNQLITAFITEKGVVYPPFSDNFKTLFDKE